MGAVRRFVLRLSHAVRPAKAERDLTREVDAHLALLEDGFRERGMSASDARRAARLALGGADQTRERHRDARSFRWLDDARRDLQYAVRLVRRNPLSSLTAALSIAISIGANTTIFTVANGLLLRASPGVAAPNRVVDITRTNGRFGVDPISYANYLDIRERATTLEGTYEYGLNFVPMSLRSEGSAGAEAIFGDVVTTNYFTVLGVPPAAGRVFGAGDSEQLDANPIVVLSHSFWARRFTRDPAIIGQTLRLNDHPFTVVGVAREGFQGTTIGAPDVWVPIGAMPFTDRGYLARESGWGLVGGRLKPDVSLAHANAEIDAIGRALARDYPSENRGTSLSVSASSPIPAALRPAAVGFLALLMGLVSLVLAIACANIAGVLLARA
ncbi:MAG TPA: ABC transporter permease, partial [Candidatus Acidoferrum sp.]|nr:ABC transporter permease [Candidatus Acidoferrum sp.]